MSSKRHIRAQGWGATGYISCWAHGGSTMGSLCGRRAMGPFPELWWLSAHASSPFVGP